MTVRELDAPAGPPWEPELNGTFERLVVESSLLAGNPLGDSTRRPLYVYTSPNPSGDRAPVVFMLQGYGGQLDTWIARKSFDPNIVERLDKMFAARDCPPAVVVFADAWTSLGGSQFVNSTSTGPYMDYICDELVPFVEQRYPVLEGRDHRGIAGHSSGGYGAMVISMLRPDCFAAFASHAGDSLFEHVYMREFPAITRILRDKFEGSYEVFFERLAERDVFDWSTFALPLCVYACAAAWSPDPDRPGKVLLPFELRTGRVVDDVWQRWLDWDPVRMAPRHADALRGMRRIYLDAGRSDEFFLDLGTQAVAAELEQLGIEHSLELFDGGHGNVSNRYPAAVRELVLALACP
jgi:enterochelin esterase-like enzyme